MLLEAEAALLDATATNAGAFAADIKLQTDRVTVEDGQNHNPISAMLGGPAENWWLHVKGCRDRYP